MSGQPGFFDLNERSATLSAADAQLRKLVFIVDFELFRLAAVHASRRMKRGRVRCREDGRWAVRRPETGGNCPL